MPAAGERFFYPRPLLRYPALYRLLVTLLRTPHRPLSAPVQTPQEPPDVTRVVLHARDLLDHPRHSWKRPQVRSKPPRHCPFAQRLIEDLEIGLLQPRPTTRSTRRPQTRRAVPTPSRIPAMNTRPAHSQPTSDLGLLQPPSGKQPRRPLAACLQTLEIATGTERLSHEARLFLHPATEGPKCHPIMRASITRGDRRLDAFTGKIRLDQSRA